MAEAAACSSAAPSRILAAAVPGFFTNSGTPCLRSAFAASTASPYALRATHGDGATVGATVGAVTVTVLVLVTSTVRVHAAAKSAAPTASAIPLAMILKRYIGARSVAQSCRCLGIGSAHGIKDDITKV